jgi:hypothetical protein
MPRDENTYQIAICFGQKWDYQEFKADSDEEAVARGIRAVNNYITSNKRPRVKNADVSRWKKSSWATNAMGRPTGGYWNLIKRLMRGRDIWRTDPKTCSNCSGKGHVHYESIVAHLHEAKLRLGLEVDHGEG